MGLMLMVRSAVDHGETGATDETPVLHSNAEYAIIIQNPFRGVGVADGGFMTGIFSGNTTVTLDKDGITLGGIRYPAKDLTIMGNYPLDLTGCTDHSTMRTTAAASAAFRSARSPSTW